MNFISTFDELNKLYEEVEPEVVEEACKEELTEAAEDEEIEIVDDEAAVEETPTEEPVVEEEPRQVICECGKCGALVIKDEADVVVDEETDLVNVEEECKFCEEAKGFKIIGSVVPYEAAEEEPIEEAFETFKKPIAWSKLKGTHTLQVVEFKNIKKGDLVFTDVTLPDKVADDDIAYCVAKVVLNGSDVSLKLGGAQGSVDADATDKCYKAVLSDGENISEDLADWYRKTFDKPASTKTQQAWEDELNGEMGEISDKRRKHLERKFLQQRDWEARHPDKAPSEPLLTPTNSTEDVE